MVTDTLTAPGADWIEILHRTDAPFAAAFTPDVSIEASVLPSALVGTHDVRAFFEATKKMYTSVGFSSESTVGPRTFLQWEGLFGGQGVAGMTVLERDAEGRICTIHLYHRPYAVVLAFSFELGRLLKGQLDDDPFSR